MEVEEDIRGRSLPGSGRAPREALLLVWWSWIHHRSRPVHEGRTAAGAGVPLVFLEEYGSLNSLLLEEQIVMVVLIFPFVAAAVLPLLRAVSYD